MAGSPNILTTTLPSGPSGIFYNGEINISGGTGTIVLSVSSGALPTGLTLQQPGIAPFVGLQGTPTTSGVYQFTITVTDDLLLTDSQYYEVTIDGGTVERAASQAPALYGTNTFEIFQLCGGRDSDESIGFAELENEMGEDGYSSQVLYGADTGLRIFKLNMPSIAGSTMSTAVTANGGTMTAAQYIWDLFSRTKVTGKPFIIRSSRNDQYYLVRFADKNLSYTRFLTKLFSSALMLKQVRVPGISVFDAKKLSNLWAWIGRGDFYYAGNLATDNSGSGHNLTINGNIATPGIVQNGFKTQRFNGGGTNTGFLNTTEDPVIYEALIAAQINEATFSNAAGLLTGSTASSALLTAVSGQTRFANLEEGDEGLVRKARGVEYRLNGILRDKTDMQAPMNEFGLIHIRIPRGLTLSNLQIGKNCGTAGTFIEMDFGEAFLFSGLNPISDVLELAEAVMEVWDV